MAENRELFNDDGEVGGRFTFTANFLTIGVLIPFSHAILE